MSEYPLSDVDQALDFLLGSVAGLIAAQRGAWLATTRCITGTHAAHDRGHGWRMRASETWQPDEPARCPRRSPRQKSPAEARLTAGLITSHLTQEAGRFRTLRLPEGPARRGVHDRIWVVFPVNADTESYFSFDRIAAAGRFSAAEIACAGDALRGIKWFHLQLLLSHGVPLAHAPLTAAERRILQHLLTGRAEKEIAGTLAISFGTVHDHVARIYRKFGVRSRAELMAIWLGARSRSSATTPVPAQPATV